MQLREAKCEVVKFRWNIVLIALHTGIKSHTVCNILGDAGYPLQPWLMTPFRKPRKKEEENYNECLTKTRQVIERTFGILKSRFRCLDRSGGVLQYTPSVCCRIIVACAVLHNYCIRHHVSLAEPPGKALCVGALGMPH